MPLPIKVHWGEKRKMSKKSANFSWKLIQVFPRKLNLANWRNAQLAKEVFLHSTSSRHFPLLCYIDPNFYKFPLPPPLNAMTCLENRLNIQHRLRRAIPIVFECHFAVGCAHHICIRGVNHCRAKIMQMQENDTTRNARHYLFFFSAPILIQLRMMNEFHVAISRKNQTMHLFQDYTKLFDISVEITTNWQMFQHFNSRIEYSTSPHNFSTFPSWIHEKTLFKFPMHLSTPKSKFVTAPLVFSKIRVTNAQVEMISLSPSASNPTISMFPRVRLVQQRKLKFPVLDAGNVSDNAFRNLG